MGIIQREMSFEAFCDAAPAMREMMERVVPEQFRGWPVLTMGGYGGGEGLYARSNASENFRRGAVAALVRFNHFVFVADINIDNVVQKEKNGSPEIKVSIFVPLPAPAAAGETGECERRGMEVLSSSIFPDGRIPFNRALIATAG